MAIRFEPVVEPEDAVEAELLVSRKKLSFLGGVDPETGTVVDPTHDLRGERVSGKILLIPGGRGSTVGSYVLMEMARRGTAPAAILTLEAEPILVVGCVLGRVPLAHRPDRDPYEALEGAERVRLEPEGKVSPVG